MLIAAFKRGDDIHDQTVSMFGVTWPRRASTARHGENDQPCRRETAFTVHDIGVTPQIAQSSSTHFAGPLAGSRFIDKTLEEARVTGLVKTMFGRRRWCLTW